VGSLKVPKSAMRSAGIPVGAGACGGLQRMPPPPCCGLNQLLDLALTGRTTAGPGAGNSAPCALLVWLAAPSSSFGRGERTGALQLCGPCPTPLCPNSALVNWSGC